MRTIKGEEQINYEKDNLLSRIKKMFKECHFERSGNSIKISDYIAMKLEDRQLSIRILTAVNQGEMINPVGENMQTDKCAFEGWAICFKAWLGDIEKVKLDWTPISTATASDGHRYHYNRFLYRVKKFKQWYDWFDYNPERQEELDRFSDLMKGAKVNSSSKNADEKQENEGIVEYRLVNDEENLKELKKVLSLDLVGHHLPVGISSFPGKQSAIDIWGLTSDNVLKVVELKYNRNKKGDLYNIKVGIISELICYCNIMNDIRNGDIGKPDNPRIEKEKELYSKKWKAVEGVMLATGYHPLLYKTKELLYLLNSNKKGIKFSMMQYEWSMPDKKLKSINFFNPECK